MGRDLSVVRPGTPSSGYPDPSIRRVRSMDSHDHWFYSVSPREKEARKQEVRKMFLAADLDGDGKLSKEEWEGVLRQAGVTVTREKVDQFFTSLDRDFDGRLTLEEFMGEETPIEKLFKLMDKNGDGYVSRKEFQQICKKMNKEQVRCAFDEFDTNGDAMLDYREFCEMVKRKEEQENN